MFNFEILLDEQPKKSKKADETPDKPKKTSASHLIDRSSPISSAPSNRPVEIEMKELNSARDAAAPPRASS